jgi:phosphoribosylaminoimidazolecarboxamide formyltransferase/IMP cyclohydrolase
MSEKRIKSALISVFYKDGLEDLVKTLHQQGVKMFSTGGTAKFIESLGFEVHLVEEITGFPSILGGRVKTLHPAVFGGILARRDHQQDLDELVEYKIPQFDLVVVNLYPFEEYLNSEATEAELIEKIDIGGVSLIRATAKNYYDTAIVSEPSDYGMVNEWLTSQEAALSQSQRKLLAQKAFRTTRDYDRLIAAWLNGRKSLRYGENPHQVAVFEGDMAGLFEQLHGKELSYNNLLDIDAGIRLVKDFDKEQVVFAILKHNNACGFARRKNTAEAYQDALAGDPVSAFGGVLVCNAAIDEETAENMHQLFFEICIAPAYSSEALRILKQKKNRILLQWNMDAPLARRMDRTILNGTLSQGVDDKVELKEHLKTVTQKEPSEQEIEDLLLANVLVKHTKSNAIILVKDGQLLAGGTGQTSRVDALRQAIHKAQSFGFDLTGSVMASDAFFPFPDCVEIASEVGISAVIQPGGSIKDELSIDSANQRKMSMVMTGVRHFRH